MKKYKAKNNNIIKFYDILSIPSNPEDLFTLLYPIGNGGFGKVYKAMHNSSKQIFAIKIIDYTKGSEDDKSNISFNYKSIQQETSLMRLVNKSEYIIKYYGSYYSRESNTIWLILEYCSAGSAVDLMLAMGRTLSEVEVATIMEMVLKGLIYIHELNLIHRDIKGANIMLSEDGYAKLGDFGIGIQMTDDEFRTSKKGSPHWMSPQVILNKNYDTKTDIWSLGITCLELVEGEPPFADLNPDEVMSQIANNPPKAEDIIDAKEHTDEFIDFVNLCLELNPKKRPSADKLIKHPFIVKLSKKNKYLKELIKNHIDEVEKFRIDKEEYLNSKDNLEDENFKDNLESENSTHIKNSYSVGNNINNNNSINNGGIKYNLDDIENKESKEISNNIDENYINYYDNDNNYDMINENNKNQNNTFINQKIKNISVLSHDNNLNLSDYTFNKNYSEKNYDFNDKNKEVIINSENEKMKENDNDNNSKNEINKKISKNKLIYNNSNSNGAKVELSDEDIRESSDEEPIHPINHCFINSNHDNNKLESIHNNTSNKNDKKKIFIPQLNFDQINKLKNNISYNENSELNTHDSPTHASSFSLFKMHNKYFD